jgi:hypothetical protein
MVYLLQERIATKQLKKPIYFQKMTGIGPMTTDKRELACEYETHGDAEMSPAQSRSLTFWDIVEG